MSSRLRALVRAKIPALRRRDAKLAELQAQLDRRARQLRRLKNRVSGLEEKLSAVEGEQAERERQERRRAARENREASFRRQIVSLRNQVYTTAEEDPEALTASRQLPFKLRNYALADSHGVRTPTILGLWAALEEIELDVLPDRFVLKSDGGAGAGASSRWSEWTGITTSPRAVDRTTPARASRNGSGSWARAPGRRSSPRSGSPRATRSVRSRRT